jgi:hypothetical protein
VYRPIVEELMLWQSVIKVAVTAVLVVAVTELGKRSSLWGAVLASLPLTSVLAFVWLYTDGGNGEAVAKLSRSIFWLVLPSLVLFLVLPVMLRSWSFWPSLATACVATIAAYFALVWVLEQLQVRL